MLYKPSTLKLNSVLERVAIIGLMRGKVFHVRSEDGGDDLGRDLAPDICEAWKLLRIHVSADETEARRELELLGASRPCSP